MTDGADGDQRNGDLTPEYSEAERSPEESPGAEVRPAEPLSADTPKPDAAPDEEPLSGVLLTDPAQAETDATAEETVADEATPAPAAPLSVRLEEAVTSRDRPWLGEVLGRGARLLLVAAIFLVPVVFDARTLSAFNLTKLTALWVFGLLAVGAWWFATHLSGERLSLPRSPILGLSFVVLGIATLATLFSPNRTLSFHGLYHRYEGLASIGMYVGVLVLIVLVFGRRPRAISEIAVSVGAASGVVALYVILQRLGVDPFNWRLPTGEEATFPVGTLGNSSFTAAFLGMAAPFVLYLLLSSRVFATRLAWSGVGAFVLIGLWFTEGRAGMLAAAAGVVALFLFTSRIRTLQKVALVGAALLALGVLPLVVGDATDRAREGVFRAGTASYRAQVWNASVRMFASRPVLGWGPESFFGQYPRFRTAADARRLGLSLTDKPHNIYLSWATATGVVGLGAYVLLVGTGLIMAARSPRLEGSRRLLAATFGAGLVAYLVQGMYSIDVPPLALMGWVALGGIAVVADRGRGPAHPAPGEADDEAPATPQGAEAAGGEEWAEGPARSSRTLRGRQAWVVNGAVLLVLALAIAFGLGPLRADHVMWAAERRAGSGWSDDKMSLYEKAISLNPREASYRALAGSYLEAVAEDPAVPFTTEGALHRAVAFHEGASSLQPHNVYYMISTALAYARLGAGVSERYFQESDKLLERAVGLDRLNPQMRNLYAQMLTQWAQAAGGAEAQMIMRRARAQASLAEALRLGHEIE